MPQLPLCGFYSGHKCTKLSSENKLPRILRRNSGAHFARGGSRLQKGRGEMDGWMEPKQLCDRNLLRNGEKGELG